MANQVRKIWCIRTLGEVKCLGQNILLEKNHPLFPSTKMNFLSGKGHVGSIHMFCT